jgi:filamentous hemagglutinin
MTVRGGNGTLGGPIINQGTVDADLAGHTIGVFNVTNRGTLRASNGGRLAVSGVVNLGVLEVGNGSTLDVSADVASDQFGTIVRHGNGALSWSGTIDNQGRTWDVDATFGGPVKVTGAVIGGTITASKGSTLTAGYTVFTSVTLAAPLITSTAYFRNGITLAPGNNLNLGQGTATFDNDPQSNVPRAIAGAGTVTLGSSTLRNGGTPLTIGPDVVLSGATNATINADAISGLTNLGRIVSDLPGGKLTITNVTNAARMEVTGSAQLSVGGLHNQAGGTVTASAGGTLILRDAVDNQGTMAVTDATLNLQAIKSPLGDLSVTRSTVLLANFASSPYTPALVRQIRSTASTFALSGQLNNTADGVPLSADARWELTGGTGAIVGGQIGSIDGTPLAASGAGGHINNVGLNTDLAIRGGATLTVDGTFNPLRPLTVRLSGPASGTASSTFSLTTGQTVGGGTSFVFDDGARNLVMAGSGTFTLGADASVRTGTGGGTVGRTNRAAVNEGTISAETPGQSITLAGNGFTNRGTLQAVNGGTLVLTLNANWVNTGSVVVDGGRLDLTGTLPAAGLGPLTIRGASTLGIGVGCTLDQVAALNVPATGTIALLTGGSVDAAGKTVTISDAAPGWELRGGTLRRAVITTDGQRSLQVVAGSSGTLDTATLNGTANVNEGATLNVSSGLTLQGGSVVLNSALSSGASLRFNGFTSLAGTGEMVFAGEGSTGLLKSVGLTIGSAVTVRSGSTGGQIVSDFQLINSGLIQSTGAGHTVSVSAPGFTNRGTLRAADQGTLDVAGPLQGDGRVEAGPGGTVTLSRGVQRQLDVTGRVVLRVKAQGGGTLAVNQLSLAGSPGAWTGTLDLADNALVVNYDAGAPSPIGTIADQVRSGWANGAWNGGGIITSRATPAAAGTTLGYAEAAGVLGLATGATATWQGQTVDDTSVLVRYTLTGDANLDGVVDFLDLARLAQSYNVVDGSRQWSNGDYNYDGDVDFLDLAQLAQNYNSALPGAAIAGAPSGFEADLARAFANVPEPSLIGLVGISALGAGRRRRKPG